MPKHMKGKRQEKNSSNNNKKAEQTQGTIAKFEVIITEIQREEKNTKITEKYNKSEQEGKKRKIQRHDSKERRGKKQHLPQGERVTARPPKEVKAPLQGRRETLAGFHTLKT